MDSLLTGWADISVGMFGEGGGWGLTYLPMHTLGVRVGGFPNDTVVPREYLPASDTCL
jgi:hypothetical protein